MDATYLVLLGILLGFSLQGASGVYRIDTVAGGNFVGDGGPALRASLRDAQGVTVDPAGNIYIADPGDHRVRKINPAGTITTVAGTGVAGFSGDDGPADRANLNAPYGVTTDAAGNLYIADLGNNRVRRVSPAGMIASLPGTFVSPRNVLADGRGNVYVSEFSANRVRRIDSDGTIVSIAGTGALGRTGDFGPAALATLNSPAGLALDSSGALYIADSSNSQVRKVAGGLITTVLGTGVPGSSAPAQLNLPTAVALDAFGNLYVADSDNRRIRKLSPTGAVSTIALPARDLVFDSGGNLLIGYEGHLTKLLASGATAVVAGDGAYLYRGDKGPASEARLNTPAAVAVSSAGSLTIADTGNGRIRAVSAAGVISTVGGPEPLRAPTAIAFDRQGSLLVADPPSALVWKLNGPTLSPAAGNGAQNFTGEGFAALSSSLAIPSGVAAAAEGGFYIADTANHRVRRVNAGGTMSTAAGSGSSGYNGDGIALGASLNGPTALASDTGGMLYIADTGNARIRRLTREGQLVTVAGGGVGPFTLRDPRGLAIDANGMLWIADTGNHRILTLSRDGTIALAAGVGSAGFSGDGGDALSAQLRSPAGLAADAAGNIYVADSGNGRVRVLLAPAAALTEAAASGYSVVNAASLQGGAVAPCSLVTIFGPDANTSPVRFDGMRAAPVSSSANQTTVQVPCSAGDSVALEAGLGWRSTLPIAQAAPALFASNAGAGQALALNQDNTPNSETNPAAIGSVVTFYATGMGRPDNPAGVVVGGMPGELLFSGDAPGLIGITQMNVRLPGPAVGVLPVLILSANLVSQTSVTVAVSLH